jgi:hypothetical protein
MKSLHADSKLAFSGNVYAEVGKSPDNMFEINFIKMCLIRGPLFNSTEQTRHTEGDLSETVHVNVFARK